MLIIAAFWLWGDDAPPQLASEENFQPSKYEERILELQVQAVEEAYKDHIAKLYSVWLADSRGQPERARAGAQNARKAFIDVMNSIEHRKEELKAFRRLQH